MTKLTETQRALLDFIVEFRDGNQYPPTMREICNAFGWSSLNTCNDHIRALVRKGYIRRIPNVARGLIVTEVAR